MDTQEPVSFHTSVEGNDQYLFMILDDQFRFLSIPEEITPTPELVDRIMFVVKPREVAEGQLLLDHGGQQTELRQLPEELHRHTVHKFRHVDSLQENTSSMDRMPERDNCLSWSLLWTNIHLLQDTFTTSVVVFLSPGDMC